VILFISAGAASSACHSPKKTPQNLGCECTLDKHTHTHTHTTPHHPVPADQSPLKHQERWAYTNRLNRLTHQTRIHLQGGVGSIQVSPVSLPGLEASADEQLLGSNIQGTCKLNYLEGAGDNGMGDRARSVSKQHTASKRWQP